MVVADLDVVARLADHQQNLPRPRSLSRVRVACLPPPPIERALNVEVPMRAHRNDLCAALAEQIGGGDGPAIVEHLVGEGAVRASIERWSREGVEVVHVVGAHAQPGFARALLARWSRGLRFEHALDDALENAFQTALSCDGVAVSSGGPRADRSSAAADRSSGCWRGFVPPLARFAGQRELRDAWVRHWSTRGYAAEVRAALLGHDPVLERALRRPLTRARLEGPVAVAITGVDGSGKSTQVAALSDSLAARGLRVRVIKLYRQGPFLELANELSGRSLGGAALDVFRVSRVVKLVDSLRVWRDEVLPAIDDRDVIVFDRYLETHEAAAGSQLAWDVADHPALAVFPAVDAEFLLRLDADAALSRIGQRGEARSADEHATGLLGYATWFDRIAARDGFTVLDASADRDANARAILDETLRIVASKPRGAQSALSHTAERPSLRVGGDGLRLGGAVAWGAPGDDVCALARFVRAHRPDVAACFTEAFWIEAYATQVLLDLRSSGGHGAEVAWWPAALSRLPEFADMVALAELERMTLALARVSSVRLDGGAARERIEMLVGDGAGRLARRYRQALEAHARERAWDVEA